MHLCCVLQPWGGVLGGRGGWDTCQPSLYPWGSHADGMWQQWDMGTWGHGERGWHRASLSILLFPWGGAELHTARAGLIHVAALPCPAAPTPQQVPTSSSSPLHNGAWPLHPTPQHWVSWAAPPALIWDLWVLLRPDSAGNPEVEAMLLQPTKQPAVSCKPQCGRGATNDAEGLWGCSAARCSLMLLSVQGGSSLESSRSMCHCLLMGT